MNKLVLNEAGQLLLPLVGIDRRKLAKIADNIVKIGIHGNAISILSDVALNIETEPEKGTHYIYIIPPNTEYKRDFIKLLKGNYYGVSSKTKTLILRNLGNTKVKWRGIFYNSEPAVKNKLKAVLGNRENLEDTVDNLYTLIDKKKFSAYKPLNELNLNIEDNRNQLKLEFNG